MPPVDRHRLRAIVFVAAGTAVAGTAVAGTAVAGAFVAGTAVAGAAVAGAAVAGATVAGRTGGECKSCDEDNTQNCVDFAEHFLLLSMQMASRLYFHCAELCSSQMRRPSLCLFRAGREGLQFIIFI